MLLLLSADMFVLSIAHMHTNKSGLKQHNFFTLLLVCTVDSFDFTNHFVKSMLQTEAGELKPQQLN